MNRLFGKHRAAPTSGHCVLPHVMAVSCTMNQRGKGNLVGVGKLSRYQGQSTKFYWLQFWLMCFGDRTCIVRVWLTSSDFPLVLFRGVQRDSHNIFRANSFKKFRLRTCLWIRTISWSFTVFLFRDFRRSRYFGDIMVARKRWSTVNKYLWLRVW